MTAGIPAELASKWIPWASGSRFAITMDIENERGAIYRKFYVFLKLRIYNSTDNDATSRRASNAAQKAFWRGTFYVSKGCH
jgi:hypothetical protein